jgi:acyl carrier protein
MKNIQLEADMNAVFDILVEQLNVEKGQLTPQAKLEEDLGADSLDKVEIIMTIDEEFHIDISDEAAEGVSTVGDLLEALAGLLPERRA